jgi:hypothetical protein
MSDRLLADCGKTRFIQKTLLKSCVWCWGPNSLRMLKKAVQQGRSEQRGEGVRFGTLSL